MGQLFFVKIDVEGYEPHVLRGLRRLVPYLSFEVNLPEFKQEGLECVEQLANIAAAGRFNYAIDCGQGLVLDNGYHYASSSKFSTHVQSQVLRCSGGLPTLHNGRDGRLLG